MAGRIPKPSAIKRLAGNPGKRPLNSREPEPPSGNLHRPEHLSERAKLEWHRVVPILTAMRVLTDADYALVAGYCQQYAMWADASDLLAKTGLLAKAKNGGIQRNPIVKIVADSLREMTRIASELGMSPAARTKVKTIDAFKGDENPWTQIGQNYQDNQSPIQ